MPRTTKAIQNDQDELARAQQFCEPTKRTCTLSRRESHSPTTSKPKRKSSMSSTAVSKKRKQDDGLSRARKYATEDLGIQFNEPKRSVASTVTSPTNPKTKRKLAATAVASPAPKKRKASAALLNAQKYATDELGLTIKGRAKGGVLLPSSRPKQPPSAATRTLKRKTGTSPSPSTATNKKRKNDLEALAHAQKYARNDMGIDIKGVSLAVVAPKRRSQRTTRNDPTPKRKADASADNKRQQEHDDLLLAQQIATAASSDLEESIHSQQRRTDSPCAHQKKARTVVRPRRPSGRKQALNLPESSSTRVTTSRRRQPIDPPAADEASAHILDVLTNNSFGLESFATAAARDAPGRAALAAIAADIQDLEVQKDLLEEHFVSEVVTGMCLRLDAVETNGSSALRSERKRLLRWAQRIDTSSY